MEKKLISNKVLIFRIVLSVLFVSVAVLFISTEYIKKTAVNTLASDDAKKTAQLVFETMNARMQEGWGKDDLNTIIDRIEFIRNGLHIASYRSKQVEELFGIIPKDKEKVNNDPLIQKAMNGEEIFEVDEETGMVRFLYPMKVSHSCIECHIGAKVDSINGVLDISFPHSDIKISLDTMSVYFIMFFVVFLIVLFYIIFSLINKKMVKPVLELTNEIEIIEKSKDLNKDVDIHTNIKELRILQNSFNSLIKTIKYYYDITIEKIYTDQLTDIFNLAKLQSDLPNFTKNHTLILVDIKSFGKINRVYGAKIADELLKQFSLKMENLIGSNGRLYRLYGDEFAIVYYETLTTNDIQKYINILKKEKFRYKDIEFILDVTVGFTNHCDGNILENANIALRAAKKNYKNIVCYDDSLAIVQEDNNHIVWLKKLENAIETDNIVPVFMPMKNTNTKKIDKYETLVRLKDGDTLYTPDKFLDVAHASGKYPIITQTIIKKSFDYFKDKDDLKFSINFALSDIENIETTKLLFENLKSYKNSSNVIIELLETEEISDFELLNNFIKDVKKYGAHIAIDDFGSGYSNFNYILNLDVDIIKLDSSLIENIFTDQNAAIVVSNLVSIAKEMKLQVIAEKVSDQKIENILTIYGVDYLQGFYIGKPQLRVLNKDEI